MKNLFSKFNLMRNLRQQTTNSSDKHLAQHSHLKKCCAECKSAQKNKRGEISISLAREEVAQPVILTVKQRKQLPRLRRQVAHSKQPCRLENMQLAPRCLDNWQLAIPLDNNWLHRLICDAEAT